MDYKEYIIPKKSGKTRKIVAPDAELKQYQHGELPMLERTFYKELKLHSLEQEDIFHGFLHGKNCITAAIKHIGYTATIMMDISNFFDSVFANNIHCKYKLDAKLFHKDGHAAQGFPSSPLVANIASVPVMAEILQKIRSITSSKTALTIYADDIAISVHDVATIPIIQRIVKRAFNSYGFEINEKKTRVKYADHGYRRILGINVGDDHVRATRKTMRKIRAAKHQAKKCQTAARSAGGLTTWSKCILPRKARTPKVDPEAAKLLNQWQCTPID